MNRIKIVGLGPGHKDYILPMAFQAVAASTLIIGSIRSLEPFKKVIEDERKTVVVYKENLMELIDVIRQEKDKHHIAVVVTGDPGFYSLMDFIKKQFPDEIFEVVPGISSYQYLFCKLNRSYKDFSLLSLHGKDLDLSTVLEQQERIFLLTDHKHTPAMIAQKLVGQGSGNYIMIVGEELSYPEEKIIEGKVADFVDREFSALCVVVIEHAMG